VLQYLKQQYCNITKTSVATTPKSHCNIRKSSVATSQKTHCNTGETVKKPYKTAPGPSPSSLPEGGKTMTLAHRNPSHHRVPQPRGGGGLLRSRGGGGTLRSRGSEEEECSDPQKDQPTSLELPPSFSSSVGSQREGGRGGSDLASVLGAARRTACGAAASECGGAGERSERGSAGIMGWDKESMGALGQVVPCAGPSGRDGRPHSINIVLRQALHSNVKTKFHPISLYIYIH
jgi:hypothetical protein